MAMFTTSTLIVLFLLTRLYLCVKEADHSVSQGFSRWGIETRDRIIQLVPVAYKTPEVLADDRSVKQVVLRGTQREDGEVEVQKVEVELFSENKGEERVTVEQVGLLVENTPTIKVEDQKIEADYVDSWAE
jgi:hypothetical protein